MKNTMYLEHFNITVNNVDEAIRFFQTAFPHFKVRGQGSELRKWVHLGDDQTYIAINEATNDPSRIAKDYDRAGFNHVGFVVEDVEEIAQNLLKSGYKRDFPKEVEQFRIRDYFADSEGNQYEFVQYLSEDPAERNLYKN